MTAVQATEDGWTGYPILHALSAFVQLFCSLTAAEDMLTTWQSIKWSPQGSLATMDLFEAALHDYNTVVCTTRDLNTLLRLQPLSSDPVLTQV